MTDKEAYELIYKYGGGEKGIIRIQEMIHIGGMELAMKNMVTVLEEQSKQPVPAEVIKWLIQGFSYIQNQMHKSNN